MGCEHKLDFLKKFEKSINRRGSMKGQIQYGGPLASLRKPGIEELSRIPTEGIKN